MRLFAVILGVCFASASAFATGPGMIPFGEPVYSGSGCPAHSVSSLRTEDAFTLLFDSYGVESTGRAATKNCHLRIPVSVPAGWSAEVTSVDYRGFARLDKGALAILTTWFRFGLRQFGGSIPTVLKGVRDDDFFRRDTAFHFPGSQTVCGKTTVQLDLWTILTAAAPARREAIAALDSADGALSFSLRWKPCRR